jgi:bifunctional non-homologous end joining protein LigD
MAQPDSTYQRRRRFDETPEPVPQAEGSDVDPLTAPPGSTFVIQQHYATRLHHDVRLEMMNGSIPVLVSWAVPKGLPRRRGVKALAVRTEDHPFEYGSFSGTIPEGNYGAGEVRIFDSGSYEITKRDGEKLTFHLEGKRLRGTYHLVRTDRADQKESWLALLSKDERPEPEPPPPLEPMLATLVSQPFDDPAFVFEPKWDGIRALAVCNETTTLVSRRGNDVTAGYPELAEVHDRLVALDAILDGEIVALVDGVPSFQKLQQRMHVRDERQLKRFMREAPVILMVFDLLYLDGTRVMNRQWSERRRLLEELVVPNEVVQLSPYVPEDGIAMYAAAAAQELEGILAKRAASIYEPGARSRSWLKIKTVMDADVVVVGWTEGSGRREGTLGSLITAVYDNAELRYVGNVGTGFDKHSIAEAVERLQTLDEAPIPFSPVVLKSRPELRSAHWVKPELVATVEYRQVTNAGRLRSPTFKGFRDDKAPTDCTIDQIKNPAAAL